MTEREHLHELEPHISDDYFRVLDAVWNNELVTHDELTQFFRQEGKSKIRQLYKGYVDDDEYISVPVKNYVWGASPDARHNYSTILLNTHDKKINKFDHANQAAPDEDIHIVRGELVDDIFKFNPHQGADRHVGYELFLTPDEHIVGNLEKAREIRQKFMLKDKNVKYWERNSKNSIPAYFIEHYVEFGRSAKLGRGRRTRFDQALLSRAQLEGDPEGFIDNFNSALSALRLPSFKDARHYFEATQGGIITLPEPLPLSAEIYQAE